MRTTGMKFLKKLSSKNYIDVHETIEESQNDETKVHQQHDDLEPIENSDDDFVESPDASAAALAAAPSRTVEPVAKVAEVTKVTEEAEAAETAGAADKDPSAEVESGNDDHKEESADFDETAETSPQVASSGKQSEESVFAWLLPFLFCESRNTDELPEGWVAGCDTSMDINNSFTLLGDETLQINSSSSDTFVEVDSPLISPELLLDQMVSCNCGHGCNEAGLGIMPSDVNSVTTNRTNTDEEDSGDHDGALAAELEPAPILEPTPEAKPDPKDPVEASPPVSAAKEKEGKTITPSQWIECPERQTSTKKSKEEKVTKTRRGVQKFLSLVKRKKKKIDEAADHVGSNVVAIEEREDSNVLPAQGQEAVARDCAEGSGEDGQNNEASLISVLSASAALTNSWTANSDVFAGVASGTAPKRRLATK